jgi:hypothetical protein
MWAVASARVERRWGPVPLGPRRGTATELVEERQLTGAGGNVSRQDDVSPDGQRFPMIKEGGGSDETVMAGK